MKKYFWSLLVVLMLTGSVAHAGAPGTIIFCGGQTDERCYTPLGQEASAPYTNTFDTSVPNIFMRGYFAEPLGTSDLYLSLYKNGAFWQGRTSNGYTPSWSSAFINLTNGVYYNDKNFGPGSYKVQISKKSGAGQTVVIAEGTFSIR